LAAAESALRRFALGFPEASEDFPWGHLAVKVKGKAFLFMSTGKGDGTFLSLSVKLPASARFALTLPFASPTGYGLGKSGWITARFDEKDDVPIYVLEEWIDESFRAIAPKHVLAKLESAEAGKKEATAEQSPERKRPRMKKRN
jgi:predicted DNA-binding protein (MmcQ/YjbR family)